MPAAARRPARRPRSRAGTTTAPAAVTTTGLPVELPAVTVQAGTLPDTPLLLADDVDALVLPLAPAAPGDDDEGVQPRAGAVDAAVRYGLDLADLADRHDVSGKPGESATVHLPRGLGAEGVLPWDGLPRRLVLVGVGSGDARDLRRAGAAVARATRGLRRVVTTAAGSADDDAATAFVEGYLLGAYRHPSRATGTPPPAPAAELVLLGDVGADVVERARTTAAATWTARVLTVTPSSTKNPGWLAGRAVELAEAAGLDVEVLDEVDLADRGFGALLAVGAGSATPPRLVVVRHRPAGGGRVPHVVVAGKGITYDTGGISIKPREAMVPMKTDMAGAAVALATVLGAAAAGLPVAVTAVLALAENAVGAASYRPSDVVRTVGGTTVEVTNTDAEGRLVLADAMQYADAELDPDVLVDVATLTGAATLGLGRQHAALFTPDDALARTLEAAGRASGEPVWRMPLVPEYRAALTSTVADVRHVPVDGFVGGGAITAALFLERFAGGRRWAHLDIAGPARASSAAHEVPEGATGYGARLLLRWLADGGADVG